jgi:hypothetical protein
VVHAVLQTSAIPVLRLRLSVSTVVLTHCALRRSARRHHHHHLHKYHSHTASVTLHELWIDWVGGGTTGVCVHAATDHHHHVATTCAYTTHCFGHCILSGTMVD